MKVKNGNGLVHKEDIKGITEVKCINCRSIKVIKFGTSSSKTTSEEKQRTYIN